MRGAVDRTAENLQPQRGDDPRRWDKRGEVVGLDRVAAPVPAKVVQEPVVGEMPNAEGAQQDSGAVGQPVDCRRCSGSKSR